MDKIQVIPSNQKIEQKSLQALKEYQAGKTTEVKDPEKFFSQL